jgi:hypothetical protein
MSDDRNPEYARGGIIPPMTRFEREGDEVIIPLPVDFAPFHAADVRSTAGITLAEVIGPNGRELVRYDVSCTLHMQDEGRTLKVFLAERHTS